MGKDELQEMTHDKWPADFWRGPMSSVSVADGALSSPEKVDRPKLYFYWGGDDHWIDNGTRDALIATRAGSGQPGETGRPHMEIDTSGVPHSFCISMRSSPELSTIGNLLLT